MKTRWLLSLAAALSFQLANAQQDSVALETVGPAIKKTKKIHTLQIQTGISAFSSSRASETGLAYGGDYFYAFSPIWAAVISAGQGVNTGLEVLTTDISGSLAYAWKGRMYTEKLEIANEGQIIANVDPLPQEAWVITAGVKQNFFNGTETILPLTGPTFTLTKRFPSATNQNALVGAGFDYTFNGDNTLMAFKVFVGVNFPVF